MIRLMVVDDSRFVFDEMKYLLKGTEIEVVKHCLNGEDAIAAYKEVHPDVVTMDIVLPTIDGFECAKELLRIDPLARIVFVSSLDYEETIQEAKKLGSQGFVFKPFQHDELLSTIVGAYLKKLPVDA